MENFVVIVQACLYKDDEIDSQSNEIDLNFYATGKKFLYYRLYYEMISVEEDGISLYLCREFDGKWKRSKKIIVKAGQKTTVTFPVNNRYYYKVDFVIKDREEYQKEKREEYLFNQLPLVKQLRIKGKRELPNYHLVLEETIEERDVYSQGKYSKVTEFEVIEGNICKSYYRPDECVFRINEIIDEHEIIVNNEKLVEGETREKEISQGGYTNDGPSYWTIRIKVYLKKKE